MSKWILKMFSVGSNACMETSAPLIHAVINNAVVPFQLAHQLDAASNHSYPVLFSGRLAAPDFVMNCIEARAVRWLEIWKFIRVSYIIALSQWRSKWRTECQRRVDTARGKDIDHAAESIKSYNIISLQIASDIW